MTLRQLLGTAFCLVLLAGCAAEEEEVILTEPMADAVMEERAVLPCETGDGDGIGGTGCEPLN